MRKARQMPYPLRMSEELREFLERMANKEDRSLNKEIVRRLEQSRRQEQRSAS